jgi:hypothetical protein
MTAKAAVAGLDTVLKKGLNVRQTEESSSADSVASEAHPSPTAARRKKWLSKSTCADRWDGGHARGRREGRW